MAHLQWLRSSGLVLSASQRRGLQKSKLYEAALVYSSVNKILNGAQCSSMSTVPKTGIESKKINNPASLYESSEWKQKQNGRTQTLKTAAIALAGTLGVGVGLSWLLKDDQRKINNGGRSLYSRLLPVGTVSAASPTEPGLIRKGLPMYTAADVAKHNSKENGGIWVTYNNGVYDITEYVQQHPGGKKILMAAGKSIAPFWDVYSVHKMEEIFEQLEAMRIGNIADHKDVKKAAADDPYRNDPERSPLLIPSNNKPFNAEPPTVMLADQFLTPNHLFFVRNHLPVPDVDPKKYRLELALDSGKAQLTLEDLQKKFPKRHVAAVTQCAGNRRSEMVKIKPVKGLNWGSAAISTAKWSGVSLDELLQAQGVDIDKVRSSHIVFEGMDKQPDDSPYGASIPIELARMLKKDIMIAYEMNGKSIPRDHGYPVRVIIPGVVGARQVKWLNKIYFSKEESMCHWQRRDYKGFNSSVDWDTVDFDKSVSISQLPVISAICEPEEGAELEEGADEVTVKGYAWSGGGRGIVRVDVSADNGKTWQVATLKPNGQSPYKSFAWTLWEVDVALPPGAKSTTLICKAVDISYNVQPDSVEGIWNLRGCLSNAWHRVKVNMTQ